jgi:hypothetical protein
MSTPEDPDEEYDFYAQPENQQPQGPPHRRRASRLSSMVPVRFPPQMLDEIRRRAEAEDRSVSSWIRAPSSTNCGLRLTCRGIRSASVGRSRSVATAHAKPVA